jgi:replicative superfamily II helicase
LFSFSSEEGRELIRRVLRDLWPHNPCDYQIEAVAKVLDGIDILAILPTGAGKTAILTMFMLSLIHIKSNPEDFKSHCSRFPDNPIMIVVYLTSCLEEEQVRVYT